MDLEDSILLVTTAVNINYWLLINMGVLLLLLILSAMVSGAEVAFFSLSGTDLEAASESKSTKHQAVALLLKNPKKLLATILISNNFINILIVLIFAYIGEYFFISFDYELNLYFFDVELRFLVEVVLITFLILLFGEVLPKVYATRNALKFASFMALPLKYLNVVLTVWSVPLMGMTRFIEKRFGFKQSNLSVEKLSQALELTSEDATTKDEQKILEGIVSFGNTETNQIMTPRIDIFALSDEEKYVKVMSKIVKKGYSRNPVYHENIDNIIGVLYTKDLLPYLNKKVFNWQQLIREPFFVPENKKLDDLLVEFQEKKNHLAVVVDEYGGTSGIVTLEDVIEEIVGDISDEFDVDDLSYSRLDKYNYVFDGKTTLKDFMKILEVENTEVFEEKKGESETIAGFILEVLGRFPKKMDLIRFDRYSFNIEVIDKRRIKQIKVTIDKEDS